MEERRKREPHTYVCVQHYLASLGYTEDPTGNAFSTGNGVYRHTITAEDIARHGTPAAMARWLQQISLD